MPTEEEKKKQVLEESTRVAQEAAQSIGGTFQQGVGFTPGTITGADLTPVPEVKVTEPQETPIFPIQALPAELPQTQPEKQAGDINSEIQKLNEQLVGQSAFRSQQESQFGIPELQKTQSELAGQLKILQAEQQAIPLRIEEESLGRGRTISGVAPIQASRLRENAIKALTTSALLQASQGQLATALEQVERATAQRFDPIKEEIAVKQANLELILRSPEFSRAEKERASRQLQIQKDRERLLDQQESNQKAILNTAITAAQNGADAVTLKKITESSTPELAVQNAGRFLAKGTQSIGEGAGIADETTETYAQLLAEGKISLANVPQNIRNKVVAASGGIIRKPLSDTAIKEIQQSESAISNLNALKQKVEQNLQFVGPIRGLARFNPFSRARQVQAEIDRVKQQVGKTLEGGVLRKEDEEKYKKILATLSDTPETAIYKIDSLVSAIQRDIENYRSLQAETGRFVPGGKKQSTPEELRKKYSY